MVDKNTALELAEAELELFLEKYPHMKAYQAEINAKLMGLTDPDDRMAVIIHMVQERQQAFKKAILELKDEINIVDSKLKETKKD